MCHIKFRRIFQDNLKQDKCFACDQIREKRKSGAYEVASRVETEDGCVTLTEAMTRNENSDDPWLQTPAKRLKVKIGNSDISAADDF